MNSHHNMGRRAALTALAATLTLCAVVMTINHVQMLQLTLSQTMTGPATAWARLHNLASLVCSLVFQWGVVALAWLTRAWAPGLAPGGADGRAEPEDAPDPVSEWPPAPQPGASPPAASADTVPDGHGRLRGL